MAETPPVSEAPSSSAAPPFTADSAAFLEAVHRCVDGGLHAIDERGRLLYLNAAAEALHGWTHAELRGRHLHDTLHHDHPGIAPDAEVSCPIIEVATSGRRATGEAVFRRRDGTHFPVTFSTEPILSDGKVTGAVVLFRHGEEEQRALAAEREAESLRDERRRLTELDKVKSTFLNLVAHELRGPLAVARGYVSMLEEGSFGPLEAADLRTAIPMVATKLAEMNTLVDQMLETARLESGKLHLTTGPVQLAAVIDQAVTAFPPVSQRNSVRFHRRTGSDRVVGDRDRLQTVVTNLLDNARKYSSPGTDIDIDLWRDGDWVRMAVRDHGLGIAAEHQDQLFTRFGRIVTADNSHIPGSGLGLHLCRELARMHGGDLTVESRAGEGSTFTLSLPAAD